MKKDNWQFLLGIFLVLLSVVIYLIHYLLFRDLHHIFIYLVGHLAFLPIEVLLVTLVIHRLLMAREKRAMLKKLNMVIGAFFSEVGTELLRLLSGFDPSIDKIRNDLMVADGWSKEKFSEVSSKLKNMQYIANSKRGNLKELKDFLTGKRTVLLLLLQNQNLLEHDTFTDLLWAVFHLTEELSNRQSLESLPATDYEHISIDIRRAYSLLISEWLDYMEHLKREYPYLFSLAIRTNPFDPNASPVIRPAQAT